MAGVGSRRDAGAETDARSSSEAIARPGTKPASARAGKAGPGTYSGTFYRTTGPAFNAVPFDPASVARTPVGTMSVAFANGNAATFSYTLDGVTRTKSIARTLFRPPAGTLCR